MPDFEIRAPFEPHGDQPAAIVELSAGVRDGARFQTLLGATGTGKTLTMAHVIAQSRRPALVMSHNKTLAAQLYGELKSLLPGNAVEYFRLLLRLLPARGVYPRHGHLHREGRLDQRGHRAAAPAGHLFVDRAAGRGGGGVGVVHLRPGQSGRLPRPHAAPRGGPGEPAPGDPARSGGHPVQAQRHRFRAGHLPGARRHGGGVPGLRGAGDPNRAVGRRGRADHPFRPAHGGHDRGTGPHGDLPRVPLRDAPPHDRGRWRPSSARRWRRRWPRSGRRGGSWRRSGSRRVPTSTSK